MNAFNLLQTNDWEIKKLLKLVLAVQLIMWSLLGLDITNLQIPIIRQLIGFIYLTFIPGALILRILKLQGLSNIETLLYTVGLSISTLMFVGLFMNTVYPLFGISRPLSITPLIITMSIIVVALCILSYVRDTGFSDMIFIDIENLLSPQALFLYLIPFFTVFGTYLVNFHRNNIILMFLIIIIALIVILIGFDRFIPSNLYPLVVFIIALSLLYHRSLISMYLVGWDIQSEYYFSNLVMTAGYWDPTIPMHANGVLSIVILAPIFSEICGMSLTWVFKIAYPFLFSLVPLCLYQIFQKQTGKKIAFLSCLFFIAFFAFYGVMLALAKQQIAELFLVLLILVMVDKNIDRMKRSTLFIVFGISLAVSHYGLSYIYMFSLISAWLILVLIENPAIQRLGSEFYSKFSGYKGEKLVENPISLEMEDRTISSTFVFLFIVFTLTWYMYVSSSSAFNAIIHICDHIAGNLFTEFLNSKAAEGIGIIMGRAVSPIHSVTKYLHLISQFFIVVGISKLLLKKTKFEKEYAAFSYVNFMVCLAALGVPYFASSFNTSRLYHVTLIFLAPFCVIGGITVFEALSRLIKVFWANQSVRSPLKMLSVFLVIFFLFNSGFVYEVAKDHPTSISLSMKSMEENTQDLGKRFIDIDYIYEQEVFSAKWISERTDDLAMIYAEYIAHEHVLTSYGMIPIYRKYFLLDRTKIIPGGVLYLRRLNVIQGIIILQETRTFSRIIGNITDISPPLGKMSKIYSNGGSEIYYYI